MSLCVCWRYAVVMWSSLWSNSVYFCMYLSAQILTAWPPSMCLSACVCEHVLEGWRQRLAAISYQLPGLIVKAVYWTLYSPWNRFINPTAGVRGTVTDQRATRQVSMKTPASLTQRRRKMLLLSADVFLELHLHGWGTFRNLNSVTGSTNWASYSKSTV